MNTYQVKQQPRILRRPEVLELTGWSKSTLYNRIESVKPISLGQRSIGFVSNEVTAILNAMISEQTPIQIKALVQELIANRTNKKGGI